MAGLCALCVLLMLAVSGCGDAKELHLESEVIAAFAAEGIALGDVVRVDRTASQEEPVKDVLLPSSMITLKNETCPDDLAVTIFGAEPEAVLAFRNVGADASGKTTRIVTQAGIGIRHRNVIVGFQNGSGCVSEAQVAAVLARLE
jgi:hypothetical protein